ncbi:unnamed protein product [Dictyota dichotoma]|uniref:Ribosomal protein S8 n=1 Tax=Dictyota dichotoma TaxID=2876 RepID=Q2TUD3_DICDH|nr:ribosomal protein S8 [Dictyota dichotoma]AAS79063.1 ribosomal protein S8 [Dictyota dichotoma]
MLVDLLSHLSNSQKVYHKSFLFHDASFCTSVLDILWDQGLIKGYAKLSNKTLLVHLLYNEGFPLIKYVCVLSKPTQRVYASRVDLARLSGFVGVTIVSTTRGIMTLEIALQLGLGGEVLAYFE